MKFLDCGAGEEGVDVIQAWTEGWVFEKGEKLDAAEGEAGAEGVEIAVEFDEGAQEVGVGDGGWFHGCRRSGEVMDKL